MFMKRCFAIFRQARLEMYKAEHNTATGAVKAVFVSKPWDPPPNPLGGCSPPAYSLYLHPATKIGRAPK